MVQCIICTTRKKKKRGAHEVFFCFFKVKVEKKKEVGTKSKMNKKVVKVEKKKEVSTKSKMKIKKR